MIDKKYQAKIKTVEEIRELIGSPPRENKVIMCHGVFDIVHPGHIRHLMYASGHADILIASLTGDEHIQKADFRPFVPENLRALNLAALDMVDFVIIDREPKPIKNLSLLQPDFLAKGYEYVEGGLHPNSQEEQDILNEFGGEMLFTPGDVVYSSSALIEGAPPELGAEKLVALLDAENLTFKDIHETIKNLGGAKVHILGDTIIDSYTYTSMIGGQTKTPTISVRFDEERKYVGGGGVVAKHLHSAGAKVVFSTVLGDDDLKEFALQDLQDFGIDVRAVIDTSRPTTNKNAIICGTHRLLKLDTLDNRVISDKILEDLKNEISSGDSDCVIFSDFRHGIFNQGTIPHFVESIPSGAFRVADSQVASRWGNILEFQEFDLITPNEREARFSLGDQDSVIRPLASKLFQQAKCKNLILKLGERGLLGYRKGSIQGDLRSFFILDSFTQRPLDPIGAGDALLAYATLAHLASGNEVISAVLGALAAAVECEQEGNIPVTPEQITEKLLGIERRVAY